jgi:hypothetical protein
MISAQGQNVSVMIDPATVKEERIPKLARIPIAIAASLVLTFGEAFLLDSLPTTFVTHIPRPVMYALNLPGVVYCYYLISTEPLPDDDIPLFQAGQDVQCYFVGLALNLPYYSVLILIGWWLIDKRRRRRIVATQVI